MVIKQCKKCGQLKDLTEFYKSSITVDGHLNICKMCAKDAGKENYKQNKPRYIAQENKARQRLKDAIEGQKYPARVGICSDCGCSFEFNKFGPQKLRCKICAVKHKAGYDSEYQKKYRSDRPKRRYNKKTTTSSSQPPDHNIKTDLKPNPVIINPDQPPCSQGPCQLAAENKNNSACVECAFRSAYVERIEGFYIPGILSSQRIPRDRTHIS